MWRGEMGFGVRVTWRIFKRRDNYLQLMSKRSLTLENKCANFGLQGEEKEKEKFVEISTRVRVKLVSSFFRNSLRRKVALMLIFSAIIFEFL